MLDQLIVPTIRAIEMSKGNVERAETVLRQSMTDLAKQLTEVVNDVLQAWRQECEGVMRGDKPAPDPATTKNLLRSLLEASRSGIDVFRQASAIGSTQIPALNALHEALAKVERLHARLVSRWHTSEDLEDIAAEELAPTAEQLDAVAAEYGFPQAWYDEDGKPF
jgi:hypothetical protein